MSEILSLTHTGENAFKLSQVKMKRQEGIKFFSEEDATMFESFDPLSEENISNDSNMLKQKHI